MLYTTSLWNSVLYPELNFITWFLSWPGDPGIYQYVWLVGKKSCSMSQRLIYHFAILLLIPSLYKINRKCHAKHYSSIQSLQLMSKMIYSTANQLFLKSKFNQKQRRETCIACVFLFMWWSLVLTHKNESMRCNLVCGHCNPQNLVEGVWPWKYNLILKKILTLLLNTIIYLWSYSMVYS